MHQEYALRGVHDVTFATLQVLSPTGGPGYWVALFGPEVLAIAPTLRELLPVLARTPLPGTALAHRFNEREQPDA